MIEVLRKGARKAERVAAVTISEFIRAIGVYPKVRDPLSSGGGLNGTGCRA
jgi:hypothetical protein